MHPIDRAVLDHCASDFAPVTSLKRQISAGSLYRHVGRLVRLGWLRKEGTQYQITDAGARQLAVSASTRPWDRLTRLYPPLGQVPTEVHRALIELILAAVVARQHPARPDRHPVFVAFGGTLHWKTSCGTFVCHALGLDPGLHVVDCAAESGKSMAVRRGSSGEAVFQRQLLETPFLVLDEFHTADAVVRKSLSPLLGGRLRVPFENDELQVRPVPLLTLNPRANASLEQQIGLSTPQIRRALLANLNAVSLPDLAVMGERALEAARAHAPLALHAPAVDCQAFHDPIVQLTRAVVTPEAQDRIDVGILVNLATGMTAFIPEPAEAIAQVGHGLGLLAETLGWARPGWIEAVSGFSLTKDTRPAQPAALEVPATTAIARVDATPVPARGPAPRQTIALTVPESGRRRGHVPDLELNDATRMRLIWFAQETGRDVDGAVDRLLDFYLTWRGQRKSLETLDTILTLADDLAVTEIPVNTLREYLEDRRRLVAHNCTFEDLPEALRVLSLLGELPLTWDWPVATTAMQQVADFMREGITAEEIARVLSQHRRLRDLGFDEATAEGVAEALNQAGVTGERREAVIRHLVDQATAGADLEGLEADIKVLQQKLARLDAQHEQRVQAVQALEGRRGACAAEIQAARTTLATLEAERAVWADELDVLRALKHFLLRKTAGTETFFTELRKLDQWRKVGGRLDDSIGAAYVANLHTQLCAFIQELAREAGIKG